MKKIGKLFYFLSTLLFLFALAGCASTQQATRQDSAAQPAAEGTVKKLDKKYAKIALYDLEAPAQIMTDYPDAAMTCKVSALTQLKLKKIFEAVEDASAGAIPKGNTLLVKTKIEDMRIVGAGARIFLGIMAGRSNMTLGVELVDGQSGQVVGKQQLSNSNSVWGAAFTGGRTDATLPSDMGAVLAEYVAAAAAK